MKKNDSSAMSAKEVRAHLKALTIDLKSAAAFGKIPDGKPNELLKYYYGKMGHTDLRSFQEWKEAGYSVKKGAKALHLWSKPKQFKGREILNEDTGETEQETYEAYSYICLFSQLMVETIAEADKRKQEKHEKRAKRAHVQVSEPVQTPEAAPAPAAPANDDLLPF